MILKSVFGFFFGIAKWFLNLLPSFNLNLNLTSVANWFINNEIFKLFWYIVPVDTFKLVIGIIITIQAFRLAIAIIIRIKSFIPTMPSN